MKNQQQEIINKLEKIEKELELIRKNIELYGTFIIFPTEEENRKLFKKIINSLKGLKYVSASYLQRKFAIGYARASRFIERLEKDKLIEPAKKGSSTRKVIKS